MEDKGFLLEAKSVSTLTRTPGAQGYLDSSSTNVELALHFSENAKEKTRSSEIASKIYMCSEALPTYHEICTPPFEVSGIHQEFPSATQPEVLSSGEPSSYKPDVREDAIRQGQLLTQTEPVDHLALKTISPTSDILVEGQASSLTVGNPGNAQTNEPISQYTCNICSEVFLAGWALELHLQLHTGTKPYQCSYCGKRYNHIQSLKRHIDGHRGVRQHYCSVCSYSCPQKSTLQEHMRKHTGEKPYSCEVCGKCFSVSSTLREHVQIHTPEKVLTCTYCGMKFRLLSYLKRHIHRHLYGEPKTVRCIMLSCGMKFANKSEMKIHFRCHTGERPFSCDLCGRSFSRKDNLKRHNLTRHIKIKKHGCNICGEKFLRINERNRHQMSCSKTN